MVAIADSDSLSGIHPDVVTSVIHFSERQADLAAACIRAIVTEAARRGDDFDGQGLPGGFLMELAAVAQVSVWESAGLRQLIPDAIPTYSEAATDLCARVKQDPLQFDDLESATLSKRLMEIWLQRFSWSAPVVLGIDVTLGEVDEDRLIDVVAQVLWKHRRSKRPAEG